MKSRRFRGWVGGGVPGFCFPSALGYRMYEHQDCRSIGRIFRRFFFFCCSRFGVIAVDLSERARSEIGRSPFVLANRCAARHQPPLCPREKKKRWSAGVSSRTPSCPESRFLLSSHFPAREHRVCLSVTDVVVVAVPLSNVRLYAGPLF